MKSRASVVEQERISVWIVAPLLMSSDSDRRNAYEAPASVCPFAHSAHDVAPPPQGIMVLPQTHHDCVLPATQKGAHQAPTHAPQSVNPVNVCTSLSGVPCLTQQMPPTFMYPVHSQPHYFPHHHPAQSNGCSARSSRSPALSRAQLGLECRSGSTKLDVHADPYQLLPAQNSHNVAPSSTLGIHEVVPVTVEPLTPPLDENGDSVVTGSQSDQSASAFVDGSQVSSISSTHSVSKHPAHNEFECVSDIPEDRLADTIALILTDFCKSNTAVKPRFPEPHDPAALFFSPFRQKSFTLNFYCKRLLQYTYCSKSCFVVAILYIVRLSERYPVFELNDFNVHRLFCTAVVLAAKFVDDTSFSNVHYAKVAGIQTPGEMNKLEAFMLKALDYRLFVSQESYCEVEAQVALIARDCT